MQTLTVQVKNGRILVDMPTDLPEGADVEIVILDDGFSVEDRAALHASLDFLNPDLAPVWCGAAVVAVVATQAGERDRSRRSGRHAVPT